MPPMRKRAKPATKPEPESESSDSDSAAEDTPNKTVAKAAADEPIAANTAAKCVHRTAKQQDGCPTWKLDADKDRVITVSEFKGKTYVNLRDYYEKGGKLLPGKGISLTVEQWRVLGECVADVNAVLNAQDGKK